MSRGPSRSKAIAKLLIAPLALAATAACSLLVNHASSQCTVDSDCATFSGTSCVQGGCVPDTAVPEGGLLDISVLPPANPPCTTTQQCLAENGGSNWICRRPDQVCVELTSIDCPTVAGDYTGDDALILGAVLPLYGPHASTGAMLANAVQLGLSDFIGGLPSASDGGLPRHIAVVFCDESQDVVRAATHLQQDLQVPAILGAGENASTLSIVHSVTSQSGQFLITPRATIDLSGYQGKDTVWRTCPSDAIEGAALTALAEQVAADVQTQYGLASVALAVVHASDVESTDLDATLRGTLILNGASVTASSNSASFLDVSYGDPDTNPTPSYSDAIGQVTTTMGSLPDVVVLTGSTQAVEGVLGGLERGWNQAVKRKPFYILSSGLQTTELLTLVAESPDNLGARIVGTAPGENDTTYANLADFLALYSGTFSDGGAPVTFGVAQAYDAFYTLAYAAAVARNTDLIGRDVAIALTTLLGAGDASSPATPVAVGPEGISDALKAIAAGKRISLEGASAPLAFDVATGNLVTDVQVWCVATGQGKPAYVDSGESYSASTKLLQGTLGNGCAD